MDYAVIKRLKVAPDAIQNHANNEIRIAASERSEERKAIQRRDFARLMRSIRILVRGAG